MQTRVFGSYLSFPLLRKLLTEKFGEDNWKISSRNEFVYIEAPLALTPNEIARCRVGDGYDDIVSAQGIKPETAASRRRRPSLASIAAATVDLESRRLIVPGKDSAPALSLEIHLEETLLRWDKVFGQVPISSGQTSDVYDAKAVRSESSHGFPPGSLEIYIEDKFVKWDKVFGEVPISSGQTSDVYGVKAVRSDSFNGFTKRAENSLKWVNKVAVKVLRQDTTQEAFEHEHAALESVTASRHRNLLSMLEAYRFEGDGVRAFHFVFPLALCSLKQLFRGTVLEEVGSVKVPLLPADLRSRIPSLWSQFEGLAGGLEHLNHHCRLAHRDIKPSNILLFDDDKSPGLIAKIADFGIAWDLDGATLHSDQRETLETKTARMYDSPEIRKLYASRKVPRALIRSEILNGEVWKLGAVFVEMLTFLILGTKGVESFHAYITTVTADGRLETDELYSLDDGEKVKPEVLEWLAILAGKDVRASEVQHIFSTMLKPTSDRPDIATVARQLQEASFSRYWDGSRMIKFTRFMDVPLLNLSDKVKSFIERTTISPIDWWPFKQGRRECPVGNTRISWAWQDTELWTDLKDAAAEQYRRSCLPMSQIPLDLPENELTTPPPAYVPPGAPASRSHTQRASGSRQRSNNAVSSTGTDIQERQAQEAQQPAYALELYWCVDCCYREPPETFHARIRIDADMSNGILFARLNHDYKSIRGWTARLFSWKTCMKIDFIRFCTVTTENKDRVKYLKTELPPKPPDGQYDYSLQGASEEVHRAIAETQIVAGMSPWQWRRRSMFWSRTKGRLQHQPDSLAMMPKRRDPRDGEWPLGTEEWGMYARQGWSLFRASRWILVMFLVNCSFYALWLGLRGKGLEKLQNALTPIAGFVGLLTTILTVLQNIDA